MSSEISIEKVEITQCVEPLDFSRENCDDDLTDNVVELEPNKSTFTNEFVEKDKSLIPSNTDSLEEVVEKENSLIPSNTDSLEEVTDNSINTLLTPISTNEFVEKENSLIPSNTDSIEEVTDNSINTVLTPIDEGEKLIEKVNNLDISNESTLETNNNKNESGVVIQNVASDSLRCLQDYNSDDDVTSDSNEDIDEIYVNATDYSSSGDDDDDEEISEIVTQNKFVKMASQPVAKEDLPMEELTPIPDISKLNLNNKEEYLHIGNVDCVLDKLVTIEAIPNKPALDIETLLFVEKGQHALGFIFDVLGPVTAPIYVVRFNSIQDIENLQIVRGTKVYCAPKSPYTQYVFLQQLLKARGSDASWVGDNEIPIEFEDCSDDEHEQELGRKRGGYKRKHDSPVLSERHKTFESSMNKINRLNTRIHTLIDSQNPLRQRIDDVFKNNAVGAQNKQRNTKEMQEVQKRVLQAPIGMTNAFQPTPAGLGQSSRCAAFYQVDDLRLPRGFDPSVPPPGYPRVNMDGFNVGLNLQDCRIRHQFYHNPVAQAAAKQSIFVPPNNSQYNSSNAAPANTTNYYTNNIRHNLPGPSHSHQ